MEALFDLERARHREAERCLSLLGDLAHTEYSYDLLHDQSYKTLVPIKTFWEWWHAYHKHGKEGLLPADWKPLDTSIQEKVLKRFALLGELADAVEVTLQEVADLAKKNEWSVRTGMRWFQRYRVGGLWGLAPGYDPEKTAAGKKFLPPLRAPGTLDAAAFEEIEGRLLILGDLARQPKVSRKDVEARAKEMGVSTRTFWNYLEDYRTYSLPGLAPMQRSDTIGASARRKPRGFNPW
jgi:hypothetical protein